jgi:hypothetical protein
MPRKRNQRANPSCPGKDPPPEPMAETSTTAANRVRKNSLKVQQNEETARAITASNHQRLTFELSDDTDASIEPQEQPLGISYQGSRLRGLYVPQGSRRQILFHLHLICHP